MGEYQGKLSNGGERIELKDAVGSVIQSFEYDDDWYSLTDGQGHSLVVRDPGADPNEWSNKAAYRFSMAAGGSPGSEDM